MIPKQEQSWPGKLLSRAPSRAALRLRRAGAAVLLGATLLTACSAQDPAPTTQAPTPTPTSAPSPAATTVVPDVPIYDATVGPAPTASASPPVHLTIPDVGIDMPVDPVGVTDDGQMVIPEDANRAGWYEFGPAPSDPQGSTLVAAHVDSRQTGIGQFAKLRKIPVGSAVTVTTADGVTHDFVVASVEKVPKEGAPVGDWFDRTGTPRLVLVTCGGKWRKDIGHYADNVVVTADPSGA